MTLKDLFFVTEFACVHGARTKFIWPVLSFIDGQTVN